MAEENQVTTKDPKKVEAGRRLAEYNCRKREAQKSKVLTWSQYYSVGAVLAVGKIGGLGYYVYQSKKEKVNVVPHQQPAPQKANKSEMEQLYYKMDKKSIVNDLYISVFAVGYSMLGKKISKMAPPSIQKFDLEDTGKLVANMAASEMTREYLIKQKILPEHINV